MLNKKILFGTAGFGILAFSTFIISQFASPFLINAGGVNILETF